MGKDMETSHLIHGSQAEFSVKASPRDKQTLVMMVPVSLKAEVKRMAIDISVVFSADNTMSMQASLSFPYQETNLRVQVLATDTKTVVLDLVDKLTHMHKQEFQWEEEGTTWILQLTIEPVVYIDLPPATTSSHKLNEMMKQEMLTDFLIKTNSRNFPCHKVLLAARSQYFLRMFESDMKESRNNVLDWRGVRDAATVETLLGYIYNAGGQRLIDVDNCYELFELAQFCLMDDLQKACIPYMKRLLNPIRAVPIFQLALKYKVEELKIFVLNFMAKTFHQCKETSSWAEMSRDGAILDMVFEAMNPDVTIFV